MVLSDTANGVEIRFPGVPELTTAVAPVFGGRPVVNVAFHLKQGLLLFEAFRLVDGDIAREAIGNFYKAEGLGLVTPEAPNVESADVKLLDHPAMRFTQRLSDKGKTGRVRTWVVVLPERDLVYQIKASEVEGSPTEPGDAFIASLTLAVPAIGGGG